MEIINEPVMNVFSRDANFNGVSLGNIPSATAGAEGNPVFINRELSWIDFNERVLAEALRKELPPLERLKFLSIVSSNFDEFFMVRVASIKNAKESAENDISGLKAGELLEKISRRVRPIIYRLFTALDEIMEALERGGLRLKRPKEWTASQREYLESFFLREIYPLLTPLRLEDELPIPSIDSYSLYAAFLLSSENEADAQNEFISLVRIPSAPERVIWLPGPREFQPAETGGEDGESAAVYWALTEDLIEAWGVYLYPGYNVKESIIFKVNRDADFSVDEKRDEDFIVAMEEVIEGREKSMPVRMVYTPGSARLKDCLAKRLSLGEEDIYEAAGPLNLGSICDLLLVRGFDHLKEKQWKNYSHPAFSDDESIWDSMSQRDILLHLPYQSFDPVVRFFQEAASDPNVAAIKTALYRTSGNSPIIRALEQASLSGKHVTAVVELKARFDEERNISWANRLEKAGVIVVYGLARLKVHAKVTIVMRREQGAVKRYVHLSTGNYNDRTARLYGDISLFTAREDIAYDAGLLFNMITGYSATQAMSRLVIAPKPLKRRLLDLIAREINRSKPEAPGRITAKMNGLADPDIIKALYRASQAGVKVFLNVRGICMLVPGVKGLSENIRVISIIDHFLEHARIYCFANGGSEEIYLASADWMPRNLERRVELMFPVLQEDLRGEIFEILSSCFRDNCQSWLLNNLGQWTRLEAGAGEKPFRAQAHFYSRAAKAQAGERTLRGEFIVRRSAVH